MSIPTLQPHRPRPTLQQGAVLEFVRGYHAANRNAPTYQEIADAMALSKPCAYEHVQELARKGYVRIVKNIARGIVVVGDRCPCCGRVTE